METDGAPKGSQVLLGGEVRTWPWDSRGPGPGTLVRVFWGRRLGSDSDAEAGIRDGWPAAAPLRNTQGHPHRHV